MAPTFATIPSLSKPACMTSLGGGVLCDQSLHREREGLALVYRWFCTIGRHHWKVDSCSITTLFWDAPEGQGWREILPVNRTSNQCIWLFILLWRRNDQICDHMYTYDIKELEHIHTYTYTYHIMVYTYTYHLMAYGQWFGWIVKDLEGIW